MKLKNRILFSLFLVIIVMILFGGSGHFYINSVNREIERISIQILEIAKHIDQSRDLNNHITIELLQSYSIDNDIKLDTLHLSGNLQNFASSIYRLLNLELVTDKDSVAIQKTFDNFYDQIKTWYPGSEPISKIKLIKNNQHLNEQLYQLHDNLENAFVERIDHLRGDSRIITYFLLGIIFLGLVLFLFIAQRIYTFFMRPLDHLNDSIKQIEEGNLKTRVPVIRDDELGAMANAFNSMADKLQRTLDSLKEEIKVRESAEQNLVDSEARYRTLFDSAHDALFLMDGETFVECNPQTLQLFGCTRDQIIGQPPYLFSPDYQPDGLSSRDKAQEMISHALKGEPQFFEWLHVRYDRTPFHAEVKLNRINLSGKDYIQAIVRNITERKQAEIDLLDSEKKLNSIMNAVPDVIYRLDPKGDFIFISESVTKYGYQVKELLGRNISEIVHPEDLEKAHYKINERRTGKRKTKLLEIRMKTKNDKYLPFELESKGVYVDPVFLVEAEGIYDYSQPNKKVFIGTQGIARDITVRKQTELALKESKERFDLALRGADLGLWDWDVPTDKMVYNQRSAEMLGYTLHEIEALSPLWKNITHPDDQVNVETALQAHLEGKVALYESEHRMKSKTGDWVWVLDRGKIFRRDEKGNPTRMAGTHLDITKRKIAEQTSQKLVKVVEQSGESVVILSLDFHIEYVNSTFERNTGYLAQEILGKEYRVIIHDPAINEMIQSVQDNKVWVGRISNRRRDGAQIIEEVTLSPVHDEQGNIINYVSVQRDISDEEKLAEQLRQAQKMESVGRLAGGIAHDFNNILTVITGYTELSLAKIDSENPLQRQIEQIQKAAQRAEALTSQLLAFSRKQVLQPKVVNINSVIRESEKMLQRLISEDIETITKLDESIWNIYVDPGQIEQVLMNLTLNARDAMPDGGIITISTQNFSLDSGFAKHMMEVADGDYIELTIIDNGRGMDQETAEQIFEPFFTTKEQGKGTGLGLATVYGIITQSGGYISVESKPGEGSIFTIYLPRIENELDKHSEGIQSIEQLKGTESVLLVEDQEDLRDLATNILTDHNYKVLPANNGQDALDKIKRRRKAPELLLTDVVMPKTNIKDFVKSVKKKFPKIKVLYMSGYTENEVVTKGVFQQNVEFLRKPFTPKNLLKKVRLILDKQK